MKTKNLSKIGFVPAEKSPISSIYFVQVKCLCNVILHGFMWKIFKSTKFCHFISFFNENKKPVKNRLMFKLKNGLLVINILCK